MLYKLRKIFKDNHFIIFTILLSFILFLLLILRAKNTGITYDEAYTYRNYVFKNPFFCFTFLFKDGTLANHHILNSFFISSLQRLIPIYYNELLIRFANIVFYVLYIVFAYKLSIMYKHKYFSFGLFMFNYGCYEFFGLARGYGMACSLILVGIYFFKLWINNKEKIKFLNFSYIFLMLACYANTVSLLGFAAILLMSFIILLKEHLVFKYIKKSFLYLCIIIPCTLLIVKYHFIISADGLPLYGSAGNFYDSVIVSLFYTYGFNNMSKLMSYIFLALLIIFSIKYRKKVLNNWLILLTILFFVILIFITIITKQMWITGRSLIPFFPMFFVSIIELINLTKNKFIPILIFCFCLIVFVFNFDLTKTREWKDNYPIKKIAYSSYKDKDSSILKPYIDNETTNFYRDKILWYKNYDIYNDLNK